MFVRVEKGFEDKNFIRTKPKNVIVFMGPPTSGKSSQALLLVDAVKARLVRGRDVLSDLTEKYETGRELVPDGVYLSALENLLNSLVHEQIVLDNIPRTDSQSRLLIRWARNNNICLHVIKLGLSEKEVIERSQKRLVCPLCGESYHDRLKPPKVMGVCDRDSIVLCEKKGDKVEVVKKGYRDHKAADERSLVILKKGGSSIHRVSAEGTVLEVAGRIRADLFLFFKNFKK